MKTILVVMDSLNRHMLDIYNPTTGAITPNINRLAKKSVIFDQHWVGSLPCMPARRDLLTGRMAFLEKGWGAVEPFDQTLPHILQQQGIFTHIITDHYHYFAAGGENYCQQFNTWDFHRGQEMDPWVSKIDCPVLPEQYFGNVKEQNERNRTRMHVEREYPGPRTFQAASDWLDNNHQSDSFFLMIDAFDPHEPFDVPSHYLDLYDDEYKGPRYDWPNYSSVQEPDEAVRHIRHRYAAKLTMIDHWLGKMLDKIDQYELWEDTCLILTTDHGYMLGEHQYMAKNYMHVYNEIAHLPMLIHWPGGPAAGERRSGLTQNIDLMPTILEMYGIEGLDGMKGHSLKNMIQDPHVQVREAAIYGYHGMAVNLTDKEHTYFRAPAQSDNHPCYFYTSVPTSFRTFLGREDEASIECGRYLKHTSYPVYRFARSKPGQKATGMQEIQNSAIYNIHEDYQQQTPLDHDPLENKLQQQLSDLLRYHDAPDEQWQRLGISMIQQGGDRDE